MRHLRPFCVILAFSLLGEGLHCLLPFPLPGSIYGLVLLFAALSLGLVKVEKVRSVSGFLLDIMPLLFVPPAVSLLDCWQTVVPVLLPVAAIIIASTLLTFGAAGKVTDLLMGRKGHGGRHD